jgi:hypothetical protein
VFEDRLIAAICVDRRKQPSLVELLDFATAPKAPTGKFLNH